MRGNLLSIVLTLVDSNPGDNETRHCKVMRRFTHDPTYGDPLCGSLINNTNYLDSIIECSYCPLGLYTTWKNVI